jgi:hypothetical protein
VEVKIDRFDMIVKVPVPLILTASYDSIVKPDRFDRRIHRLERPVSGGRITGLV